MNVKTTFVLLALLGGSLVWLFWSRSRQSSATPAETRITSIDQGVEQSLFKDGLDDIVKVSCIQPDGATLRFERESADADKWHMAEPFEADVARYEVDGIVNRIKSLKYYVKYGPNDESLTPDQAGLNPPTADVTFEDATGHASRVQVGKSAGSNEQYVRLGGGGDIYLVRSSLDRLIKESPNDYRDKTLFSFTPTDAVNIDLQRDPGGSSEEDYRIVKVGSDWMFEAPFNAKAQRKPIDDLLRSMGRLRAIDWADKEADVQMTAFGLAPPEVRVTVTCQKEVPVPQAEDNAKEESTDASKPDDATKSEDASTEAKDQTPKTTLETSTYTLLVSSTGPLGKDNARYAMLADGTAVCTIAKSIADKMVPKIEDWREMDVVPQPVMGANRIELRTAGGGSAVFVKSDADWHFESDDAPADGESIKELLQRIDGLKAVSFVDGESVNDSKFGLTDPEVTVTVTVPGKEQPITLSVGGPTDAMSKRLYYVRSGHENSIAKVRVESIEALMRDPVEYHDRQVLGLAPSALQSVEITRPNVVTSKSETIALVSNDSHWSISEPVQADVDSVAVTAFAATLAELRARSIVSTTGDESDYGLDEPTMTVTVSYVAPGYAPPPPTDDATPAPPPLMEARIAIAATDEHVYARRDDQPTIYELDRGQYDALTAELHSKSIWEFEQSQVSAMAISTDTGTHRFEKKDDHWLYGPEPDLPIDPKKVTNLLLQINDLKLKRMVAYNVDDPSAYGLDAPGRRVTVETDDGASRELLISDRMVSEDSDRSVYAMLAGESNVFLITGDTVSRTDVNIGEFELAAAHP